MSEENLFNPGWVYGMGFRPSEKERKYPEIILKTTLEHARGLESLVREDVFVSRLVSVEQYLKEKAPFWLPNDEQQAQHSLSFAAEPRFGFKGCGYVEERGEEVWYCFPLTHAHAPVLSLTLHALTSVLNGALAGIVLSKSDAPVSNRKQLLEVSAFTRPGEPFYGHPLGGFIYPAFRRWLVTFANPPAGKSRPSDHSQDVHLPKPVQQALHSAWKAIAWAEAAKYIRDCSGSISSDGRFIFTCFGNACDIAMYPESSFRSEPSSFSCHNLDGAEQQLTLLAGLAALYELMALEVEGE